MTNEQQIAQFRTTYTALRTEIGKVLVGQDAIVDSTLIALFGGGHVLLEGVPGLGKTLLVRTLGEVLDLSFSRIQFTPDLMPADILGTNLVMEAPGGRREFQFQRGPIFAHLVLADEINRATPKTQSAMLEAMQEKQVTLFGDIRKLAPPFFVMATQNPLEQEGTYPLPEAQLDRFFYKLVVQYSGRQELHEILNRTTTSTQTKVSPVLDAERIIAHQQLVRRVVIAPHVQDYAIRVTLATHPQGMYAIPMTNQFLRVGASPRAAQTITLASKVRALLDGRFHVSFKDIKEVLVPAMRHRVILNFEGEAEGITTDMVLEKIMAEVPTTIEGEAPVGAGR
jgi:MoxR-like ATPase